MRKLTLWTNRLGDAALVMMMAAVPLVAAGALAHAF